MNAFSILTPLLTITASTRIKSNLDRIKEQYMTVTICNDFDEINKGSL
jgi:hypothetical protein